MMGITFYLVALAMPVAWLLTTVLLFLAARGTRVPAAPIVLAAALPWLAGLAGAQRAVSSAFDPPADANPFVSWAVVAVTEATLGRAFGATLGSGLLAAVASGLAVGGLAQRAPRRSVAAAAIGLFASLPLFGVILWTALPSLGIGPGVVPLVLTGPSAPLVAALGSAAAGADEPHGRSGALAAAAPIAIGLAVLAGCAVARDSATIEVRRALTLDPAGGSAESYLQAVLAMTLLGWGSYLVLPLAFAAAGGVALWAALRMRPSVGRIGGAVALVLTALLIGAADMWVAAQAANVFEHLTGGGAI